MLKYEILKPWDSNEVFVFAPGTSMTGTVQPNESASLTLIFKPTVSRQYSTSISVSTQTGVFTFDVAGRGTYFVLGLSVRR